MSELSDEENTNLWAMVAAVIGYNELAKQAKTLGEKVYFRLARDHAEAAYVEGGGKAFIDHSEEAVLTLDVPSGMPRIAFRAHDIELMREAVARWDAEPGGEP